MKRGKTVAPPRCPDWASPVVVEVVEGEAPPVVEEAILREYAWDMEEWADLFSRFHPSNENQLIF